MSESADITSPPPGWDDFEPLVARRRASGFSAAVMAREMGVHRETVGRYERAEVTSVNARWRRDYVEALDRLEVARGE